MSGFSVLIHWSICIFVLIACNCYYNSSEVRLVTGSDSLDVHHKMNTYKCHTYLKGIYSAMKKHEMMTSVVRS